MVDKAFQADPDALLDLVVRLGCFEGLCCWHGIHHSIKYKSRQHTEPSNAICGSGDRSCFLPLFSNHLATEYFTTYLSALILKHPLLTAQDRSAARFTALVVPPAPPFRNAKAILPPICQASTRIVLSEARHPTLFRKIQNKSQAHGARLTNILGGKQQLLTQRLGRLHMQ